MKFDLEQIGLTRFAIEYQLVGIFAIFFGFICE
jgi:hypothetical protein